MLRCQLFLDLDSFYSFYWSMQLSYQPLSKHVNSFSIATRVIIILPSLKTEIVQMNMQSGSNHKLVFCIWVLWVTCAEPKHSQALQKQNTWCFVMQKKPHDFTFVSFLLMAPVPIHNTLENHLILLNLIPCCSVNCFYLISNLWLCLHGLGGLVYMW